MILSASRRTDLPAYYGDWLLNRLQAGRVLVPNPRNPLQVSRVELSPELVDCIVLWTKNPLPMLDKLDYLDRMGYRYCFQFTLTPYGRELEPGLPPKEDLVQAFIALGKRLGRDRVQWRYDPVILDRELTVEYHAARFRQLCEALHPYACGVTLSFVDRYAKLRGSSIRELERDEMEAVGEAVGRIAGEWGLPVWTCCKAVDLTPFGIEKGACIDPRRLELVCGYPLPIPRERNQRPGCGCCESVEIGMYDTCLTGCVYCYANRSARAVQSRVLLHDPLGEQLAGGPVPGARILQRKGKSYKSGQMTLP